MTDYGATSYDMSAMNLIVAFVVVFSLALVIAWIVSPRLRSWLEQPALRFRRDALAYDQALPAPVTASKPE